MQWLFHLWCLALHVLHRQCFNAGAIYALPLPHLSPSSTDPHTTTFFIQNSKATCIQLRSKHTVFAAVRQMSLFWGLLACCNRHKPRHPDACSKQIHATCMQGRCSLTYQCNKYRQDLLGLHTGGGHQNSSGVLATAHEPDSLAASFSTCTGAFKPAPRPPVKTATPCKASQPLALTRETHKAEEHFVAQLRDSDDMYSQPQTDNGELGELQDVGNDSLSRLIQSWFKEQRHFSDNVQLRKQHSLLSWQLQKLRKHLGERQHQKMQHKGK